jgi:flagellum-specific peptidoglycan hydrolase FlgJ
MSATSDYIAQYSQDMVDACNNTGLFPSVMMAQGILESNNGKSLLAYQYNNHFGIKCLCKACPCYLLGERVNLPTTEEVNGQTQHIDDWFRTYATTYDGFVDRVNFLKTNPTYTNNGVFSASTPQDQTQALLNAGYATESDYATQLNNLIDEFNLESLDTMPPTSIRITTNTWIYVGIGAVALSLSLYLYFKFHKK